MVAVADLARAVGLWRAPDPGSGIGGGPGRQDPAEIRRRPRLDPQSL